MYVVSAWLKAQGPFVSWVSTTRYAKKLFSGELTTQKPLVLLLSSEVKSGLGFLFDPHAVLSVDS